MARELIYTLPSLVDIDEIRNYISSDSKLRAEKFSNMLMSKVENLKEFPNLGFKDKLGLSKYIIDKNYIVYYYVKESKVYVLGLRNVKLKIN